jgi:nitroreductase
MSPDDLYRTIRARRSSLLIDPTRDIDDAVITQLCDAVQWAPNHKRTWPARLAVLRGDARSRLGNAIADVMQAQDEDDAKVTKTRTKYLRSPVVLVAASAIGDTDNRTRENTFAVAAGLQNMLLLAHQHGLACLWGSPANGANDAITTLCGFESDATVIALVYLGWPTSQASEVPRPAVRVNYVND